MPISKVVDERGPSNIYWVTDDNGFNTIFVRHPHNSKVSENSDMRARSRYFANWARSQFGKPSEYVQRKLGYFDDRYFVMYGLTANEMMLIKLTWSLDSEPMRWKEDLLSDSSMKSLWGKSIYRRYATPCSESKIDVIQQYTDLLSDLES